MAIGKSRLYLVCSAFLICCFISVTEAFLSNGFLQNPSSYVVDTFQLDDSHSKDLSQTSYYLYKREAPVPIKKAIHHEKKNLLKSFPTTDTFQKKNDDGNNSSQENTTVLFNSTVVNYTTSETSIPTTKLNGSNLQPISTSTTTIPSTSTDFQKVLSTMPSDITNTTEDYHVYYNSSFLEEEKAMSFWVDFESLPEDKIVTHGMLSDSHRRAATVELTFDFPFYGHPLRNITIATGGFLYMGTHMHSWLAATQYVAPLMANFDTSLSNESTVRYFDNGTAFVIEWNEVTLQDKKQGGNFTFQATLLSNGNIVFVYQTIPISITEIRDDVHPVKVGLSDAYVIDRVIFFIRRKTIYEYHRVNMKRRDITNHTAIYFRALTTCLHYQNCESCMGSDVGLECVWCESAKRCSDGLDRMRQDWLQLQCNVEKSKVICSNLPSPANMEPAIQPFDDNPFKIHSINTSSITHDDIPAKAPAFPQQPFKADMTVDTDDISHSARVAEQEGTLGVGSVVSILLLVALLLGIAFWIGYAYRNPHTFSGQLLIKYRPTQWRFRTGEARYTAASVHM